MNYYVAAISRYYPTIILLSSGPNYSDLIVDPDSPTQLPDQTTLDANVLSMKQSDMWLNIKTERDRRKLECGYKVNISGTDHWFHSDTFSRTQQLGLVMLGANIPQGLQWKTMSGDFVTMTQTLAGQIFQAAAASDIAIFTVGEQKHAAMIASQDPASYDYLSGWPLGYGE